MRNQSLKKVTFISIIISSLIFFSINCFSADKDSVSLSKTMRWSCFDVGSSGYVQASALADALSKNFGTKIRLLPSGNAIGRLMPVTTGKVDCGHLTNEAFFAAEGTYDFSSIEWGPQDLRVILAHPGTIGCATTKTGGIKTIKDLKGKRVAWVPGSPNINTKMEAFLAFGGYSFDDVELIEMPNYAASMRAVLEGKTDAAVASSTASIMYELESSPKGIHWIEFPPENKEGWARLQKLAPYFSPFKESIGAGIDKNKPLDFPAYRYPMITVYADKDVDWVYNLTKAIDLTFEDYKDAMAIMYLWEIKYSGVPPADIPFHEGAIKYLKEKGVWKAEHDAWNNARISHMKKVQQAWEKALEKAEAQKIKAKDFSKFWLEERKIALQD
jgi:uncharacterized protein